MARRTLGGAAGGAQVEVEEAPEETISEQLDRAETDINRLLATPDLPEETRGLLQQQLQEVQLAAGDVSRQSSTLGRVQGLGTRTVAQIGGIASVPLSLLSSTVKEGVVDPLRSGEDASLGEWWSQIGVDFSWSDRPVKIDTAEQIGFGDIFAGVGGESTTAVWARRGAGFAGEVFADPLNYLFGAGLAVDAARVGSREAGQNAARIAAANADTAARTSRLVPLSTAYGTTNRQMADAVRVAVEGGTLPAQALDVAAKIDTTRVSSLTRQERALVSEIVHFGISFRQPFTTKAYAIPGTEAAAQVARLIGSHTNPLRSYKPGAAAKANVAAATGRLQPDGSELVARSNGETSKTLRENKLATLVDTVFEQPLSRTLEPFDGQKWADSLLATRYSREAASRRNLLHARSVHRTYDALGIEHRRGNITMAGRDRVADLTADGNGRKIIDAVENGNTSVTLTRRNGDSFDFDTGQLSGAFEETFEMLQQAGVSVGYQPNYIARVVSEDWALRARELDEYHQLRKAGQMPAARTLLQRRKWAEGDVIGFTDEGAPIILPDGRLETVERMFAQMGAKNFEHPFKHDNVLDILDRYQKSAADLAARQHLGDALHAEGVFVNVDSVRGLSNRAAIRTLISSGGGYNVPLETWRKVLGVSDNQVLDIEGSLASRADVNQAVVSALSRGRVRDLMNTISANAKEMGLSKAEVESLRQPMARLSELVHLDNISYSSLRNDPSRVSQFIDDFVRTATDDTVIELYDAAHAIYWRAHDYYNEAENAARRFGDENPDASSLVTEEVTQLRRLGDYYLVEAQAAMTAGFLRSIPGAGNFNDTRFIDFATNIGPKQQANLLRGLRHQQQDLYHVTSTDAVDPAFARYMSWEANLPESLVESGKVARWLTKRFKAAATFSPGFVHRNYYSAGFTNWSQARVGISDYKQSMKELKLGLAAREVELAGGDASGLWAKLGTSQERVQEILRSAATGGPDTQAADAFRQQTRDGARGVGTVADRTRGPIGRAADGFENLANSSGSSTARAAQRGLDTLARVPIHEQLTSLAEQYDTFFSRKVSFGVENTSVEEIQRFTLMNTVMKRGTHNFEQARDFMWESHFDYSDLTRFDRTARDFGFPFWTFMSRNLPLHLEMLARRPGAYNNLIRYQFEADREHGDPLRPEWYDNFLQFALPEDVQEHMARAGDTAIEGINASIGRIPGVGGALAAGPNALLAQLGSIDVLTPDLQINDVIGRANEFGGIFDGQMQAPLRGILSDASPWVKAVYEFSAGEDAFTQRPLVRDDGSALFEEPLGAVGPLDEDVSGLLWRMISWTGHSRMNADGEWEVDARFNNTIQNFLPLLGRMRRLAPDEERYQDRVTASWVSYMLGGVRTVTPTDRISAAYGLSTRQRELLKTMEDLGYTVPTSSQINSTSTGSSRGR